MSWYIYLIKMRGFTFRWKSYGPMPHESTGNKTSVDLPRILKFYVT
jgi:hypothetical protein